MKWVIVLSIYLSFILFLSYSANSESGRGASSLEVPRLLITVLFQIKCFFSLFLFLFIMYFFDQHDWCDLYSEKHSNPRKCQRSFYNLFFFKLNKITASYCQDVRQRKEKHQSEIFSVFYSDIAQVSEPWKVVPSRRCQNFDYKLWQFNADFLSIRTSLKHRWFGKLDSHSQ